ncbi:hypothetical protein SRHO_G00333840 [Serrasalmus rhombeus]
MPVNFMPVPSWGESGNQSSYSADSISHNISMIDGQTDLCDDRTTQWVTDLQDTPEVGQIEDTEDWCEKRGRGSLDFEDGAGTQQEDDRGEPVIGLDDTASIWSAEISQNQPHSLSCHGDTEHVEISSTTIRSRNNMVSTVPVEDTLPTNTLEPPSPSSKCRGPVAVDDKAVSASILKGWQSLTMLLRVFIATDIAHKMVLATRPTSVEELITITREKFKPHLDSTIRRP